jgi:hypothetical protein
VDFTTFNENLLQKGITMSYNDLDKQEKIAYEWQKGMMGGFYKTIMDACAFADKENLAKLEKGFPDLVEAYRKFSNVSGWWQSIEKKVGI